MHPDIVYIYGSNHSRWHGLEIIYSLRSLEIYGRNYGRVFIAGDKSRLLNSEVTHIPKSEDIAHCKERRIYEKLLEVCKDPQPTEEFVVFNDDYFLTKEIDFSNLNYFYHLRLSEKIARRKKADAYHRAMKNTEAVLKERGYSDYYFDIHYPMYYNKTKFLQIMQSYDWDVPAGYVIKSLYCNSAAVEPIAERRDNKIYISHSRAQIIQAMHDMDLLSTDMITRTMANVLMEKYPKKSKYEL